MVKNFNKSIEQPRFIHKPNPFAKRSWQIFELKHKGQYEPVGEYVLVNMDEDPEITDKKIKNLVAILNRKKDLIDISNLTTTRVLYTVVRGTQAADQTKIILRDYDGSAVSKDNAIFTIRKGVFKDG